MVAMRARTGEAPRWILFAGVFGWMALMRVASWLGDGAIVLLFVLGTAFLGLAGFLWGADSRDGADWKPRP
jgi:hypothetical protein